MESIADRYDRLAGAFADKVAAVPADRWSAPSPCAGWDALALVQHVSESPGLFLGFVGQEMGELPPSADDPGATFAASRRAVRAALADPAIADAEYEGFMGKATFAEGIDQFICFDLVVHGWDLARTAGLGETIADADLDALEAQVERFGDALRSPGAFGPAVEPPAGAGRQTRILCFLGRPA